MNPSRETLGNLTLIALWFGASVSIAEIMTGGVLAPMGFSAAFIGIVIGHIIGGFLLYAGGRLGSQMKEPSMVCTQMAFGKGGSWLFAILNILQLIGWTAIMIITGAAAAEAISVQAFGMSAQGVWTIALGGAIIAWIALGKAGFSKLNVIAVGLLFGLSIVLGIMVLGKDAVYSPVEATEGLSAGLALELSIIMPLSWLPLIADYTCKARNPKQGALFSALGYTFGSTLMYVIGLGAALYSGSADPAQMLLAANLGLFALAIVVLSTVTTTFMDAYSAGVSTLALFPKLNSRYVAIFMATVGLGLALWVPMQQYEHFLYAIGSVFGPLFAIVLSDFYLFKNRFIDPTLLLHVNAIGAWLIGVGAYYVFQGLAWSIGAVLPAMVVTGIVYILIKKVLPHWKIIRS
jgi:putative hydroxymethylpyrimidine transporter CytX